MTKKKKKLGRKSFFWLHIQITVHHQRKSGQDPGGRNLSKNYGLALLTGWICLLSYIPEDQLSGADNAHSKLSPATSITNQENSL